MSIEFEDCFIYSLRGDEGLGGDRNVDGMWGKDDLHMKVQYNSISGLNSLIRISKDQFNVLNENFDGTNIFDNVSIFSREWNRERPYGERDTEIIIKWPIFVRVVDDHTKLGIPDADVSIWIKNEFDEWESIRNGETDQNGYVRFYSIISRIMKGDDLGKDETVRINVMKYSYQDLRQLPLASPLNEIIFLKILALNIEEVSYRSVLVGDNKLTKVPLSSVRNGAPLGGIIYINGTADISSQTESITEVGVSVDGGPSTKVQDISDSNDWSKWSYKLETVRKTGKDVKTKIQNVYDLIDLYLKFSAFETHGFTTEAGISLNINQSRINNPPTAEITKIEGLDLIEDEDREIRLPPIKEKLIAIEGTFFDIDGDTISKAEVRVSVLPTDAGKTVEQPMISDSKNTRIDFENKTWTVDWFLLYSNFPAGNYEISIIVSDGDLNSSDSDHFTAKTVKMHIFLESNPKVNKVLAAGVDVSDYVEGIKVKEGGSMLFKVDASTDVGASITRYMWTITDTATKAIIVEQEKTSEKFPHTFTIPKKMKVKTDLILEVKVFVIDSRGYRSAVKEFEVTVDYEPPEAQTVGFLADVEVPGVIDVGDTLFIVLIVLYIGGFLIIKTKSKNVKKKITKRSEVAKKRTKVEQQKKIKSLAEIEGRGKDNVMYVPGGVGAQDYSPTGQLYGEDIPPVGSYQDPYASAPGPAFGSAPPATAYPPQPAISTTTAPVSSPVVTTTAPVTQPVTVHTTAPVTHPVTTYSTAPATQPFSTPTTAPVTRPVTAPTTTPVTHPVTAPTTTPVTQPVTAPTTTPVTHPVTAPTTAPVTRPITAPTTAPVTQMTAPPFMAPPTQPAVQPTGAATPGKTCPGCGNEIKPGWFICPKCKSIL